MAWPTSPIPDRPPAPRRGGCWRTSVRRRCTRGLAEVDPATAARLRPSDSQRIARAWEVWRGTGARPRRLADRTRRARRRGGSPPSCSIRRATHCAPPSPRGFAAMLRAGRASRRCGRCWRSGLDPALPAMRAHGVPELAAYLRGELDAGRGRRGGPTGDRAIHQAAGDLVPPPRTRCRRRARIRSMRDSRVWRNFRKEIPPHLLAFIESHGLTHRTIAAYRCAPLMHHGSQRQCRQNAAQSGAEILLRALKDQGVEVIFGYPGGAVLPIYDALFKQNAIRHILVRQEQAARCMRPRAMRAPPARSAWCW